jgi:Glycosyltransferase family 87
VDADERRLAAFVAALAASVFLVSWGVLQYGFYTHRLLLDTPVYERYGDRILGGKVPYRDFAVEYPPGSLPVFVAPSVVVGRHSFHAYTQVFEALMGIFGAVAAASAAAILVRLGAGRLRLAAALGLAGLGSLALGPVVLSRFDLWPAALAAAALAALAWDRRLPAFVLIGVAFAAKIYPLVLVPPMLVYVWRRDGRRSALTGAGAFLAVVALAFLPFLVLSPHGLWASVSGQASRPLQIETLGASVLIAAHHLFGTQAIVLASHGSDNLWGSTPDRLASIQSVLQTLVVVALWIAFARGPATFDRLVRMCAAGVCAFVALGKVLSPQYLIWLLPLVPLVRGRRGATAGALLLLAMILTQLWFPYRYIALADRLDPAASWLVLARDAVLVAMLVVLAWPERAEPTPVAVTDL